jgi:hypothetical protein
MKTILRVLLTGSIFALGTTPLTSVATSPATVTELAATPARL